MPTHKLAVFLTLASHPTHKPADSSLEIPVAFCRHFEIVGCARGEGFNRSVPISVQKSHMMMFKKLLCTEIGGSAAGIESARYDFPRRDPSDERFLWSFLSRKERIPIKLRHYPAFSLFFFLPFCIIEKPQKTKPLALFRQ